MRYEDALTFAGTRLAFHTHQAAETLGKACLDSYEGTLHILNRGK